MRPYYLLGVVVLGLTGSLVCRADIVVNYPPSGCPPCDVASSGQPDLLNPGPAGLGQRFTLNSAVDLTGITFWTYEEQGTWNLPVQWSIQDLSGNTVVSGTDPTTDTPLMFPILTQMGLNLQLSEITVNLAGPIAVGNNSGPTTYALNLKFSLPTDPNATLFYWADGGDGHDAFQLTDANSDPITPTVPEPSYLGFLAGGLAILTAYRIKTKYSRAGCSPDRSLK